MSQYTIFDSTSGEILSNIDVDASDIAANVGAGEDSILGYFLSDEYYIVNPATTKVPTLKADPTISWNFTTIDGDATDAATASGIPNPSTVSYDINGMSGVKPISDTNVTDGTLVYKTPGAGTVTISIDAGLTFLLHEQLITVDKV